MSGTLDFRDERVYRAHSACHGATGRQKRHRPSLDYHHGPMPGLSYPFVFECSNCKSRTTVERSDADDLHPDPDSLHAIDMVLEDRGWVKDGIDPLIFCPDCRPREA